MTAFRIERDALAKAAAQVARIAGKSQPFHATRIEVDGDKATLAADDGDVSIATTLAVADGANGAVGVPAKRLAEAAKALRPGAVTVAHDEVAKVLRLSCGPSRAELPTIDARDLPPATTMGEGSLIDRAELVAMLARVLSAASRDDSRPILTGVLFEAVEGRLRLVATDSYRLAYGDTACPWGEVALVPAMALAELTRIDGDGPLALERDGVSLSFGVASTVLRTRLIEGEFPNYRQLIPSPPYRLVAPADELAEAVRRVGQGDTGGPQRWALGGSLAGLALSTQRSDGSHVDDEVAVEWDGPDLVVTFNADFLADALAAVTAERVVIGVCDALKPVLVGGEDDGAWATLLMPVRV